MLSNNCTSQTLSKYFLGFIFLGLAVSFVVMGFTLFPIFGFFLAVPMAGLSYYFFRVHLNDQCEIDLSS